MLLIATLNIARDAGWNALVVAGLAIVIGLVAYLMLAGAMRNAERRREQADLEGSSR